MRRALLVMVLLLGSAVTVQRPARGQAIVNDTLHMGMQGVNFLKQFVEMLNHIGISTENLDWVKEMLDYANKAEDLLKDIGTLNNMVQSLNTQARVIYSYKNMLGNLQNIGFAPQMVMTLYDRLTFAEKSVQDMITQFMKILTDVGLTKDKKIEMGEEMAKRIALTTYNETRFMMESMDYWETYMGVLEVDNLLDGRDPRADVQDVGNPEPLADTYQDVEGLDGFQQEKVVATNLGSMGMKTVRYLTWILLALSLIGITVRFMRGDPGSEAGFARVFVVMIAAITLFIVLNAVLKV